MNTYSEIRKVKAINKNGLEVNVNMIVHFVENYSVLQVCNKNITYLEMPEGVSQFTCIGSSVKELWIPKNLKILSCNKNVKLRGDWQRKGLHIKMT